MPITTLDPRTALVVIDLQQGLRGVPVNRPFAGVVANANRLASAFRAAKLPVIWVTVGFSADGADAPRPRSEAPARATPTDPEFFKLMPEVEVQPTDLHVQKRQPSAFYGTDLDLQLRRRGITGIVLAGVSTTNGVDSTGRAAHERNYHLTYALDAMADPDAAFEEQVVKKMFPRLGETDSTDAIVTMLGRSR